MINASNISIQFNGPPLLNDASFRIQPGERIGLLGRNGAGKSTLFKIINRDIFPDSGLMELAPNIKIASLPQDVPHQLAGTIHDVVLTGVDVAIDDEHHWQAEHAVDQILSRMQLDPTAMVEQLSAGMKRRVLLAKALVNSPDLLLLDEPTNHLDIASIEWLEQFLGKWSKAFMFVTHDRAFLQKLANRILEIEHGRLFDWSCDYKTFLSRKAAAMEAQEKQDALFDKKLAQEEVWIRQGVKARRTRNEGRVRALKELRKQRSSRPNAVGTARIQIQEAQRSGNLVLEATDITGQYDDRVIFDNFSLTLMRGDKIGIIGRNGVGKSTLLKILLGKQTSPTGSMRWGTNVEALYFDQMRQQLDDERTVQDVVGDGYQTIHINGKQQHVIGYLQEFLFTPERSRTPVKLLSGGERNRVLLAKLFAKPANLIVMDEPTNDLDEETLELLEDRLVEFSGTVIVVSHDREFLNNVVTSCLVFENEGIKEYFGGYDDWLRQTANNENNAVIDGKSNQLQATTGKSNSVENRKVKLSFKEQKEFAKLPKQIEEIESRVATMHTEMLNSDYYKQPSDMIVLYQQQLATLESQLAQLYSRWESLSERQTA